MHEVLLQPLLCGSVRSSRPAQICVCDWKELSCFSSGLAMCVCVRVFVHIFYPLALLWVNQLKSLATVLDFCMLE